MTSLRSVRFSVVDLETTGINVRSDEILAIGIVPMIGTRILLGNAYYSLVKPKRFKIDSIKFHGLDPKKLKQARCFDELAGEVYDRIKDSVIVGYSVEIDYKFLKRELSRFGYNLDVKTLDVLQVEYLLSKKLIWEDLSLDALAKRYGIGHYCRHNALADAIITAQIFQIQLLKLIKSGIDSLENLYEVLKSITDSRSDFHTLRF